MEIVDTPNRFTLRTDEIVEPRLPEGVTFAEEPHFSVAMPPRFLVEIPTLRIPISGHRILLLSLAGLVVVAEGETCRFQFSDNCLVVGLVKGDANRRLLFNETWGLDRRRLEFRHHDLVR